MSLGFLLWFLLAVILLGATLWTTIILMQQKRAWKEYAKTKGLTFTSGKFFASPSIEGIVEGYNVSFFAALRQETDARKNRQLTVMQVNANTPFVDGVAAGTIEMLPFLQTLEGLSPHDLKTGKLGKDIDLRSRNKTAVDAYLTEGRVKAINSILSMPNADIIILLDAKEGVFRFETSNPLKSASQIDSVISKLLVRIKKLEPSADEAEELAGLIKPDDLTDKVT